MATGNSVEQLIDMFQRMWKLTVRKESLTDVKDLARFVFNAGLNGSIPDTAKVIVRNSDTKSEYEVMGLVFDGEMNLRLYIDEVDSPIRSEVSGDE